MVFDLTRRDWGAQSPHRAYRQISLGSRPGLEGHHSVGTYGASTFGQFLRSLQRDHLGRDWTDGFYNVCYWPDGQIGEMRPDSATSGSVTRLTGCLAGNFETRNLTFEMRRAVQRHRSYYVQLGLHRSVRVHGDRASVACPGRNSLPMWRDLHGSAGVDYAPFTKPGQRVLRLSTPYMRGEDVRVWQGWLNDFLLAFKQGSISRDGIFGPRTAEASSFFMRKRMDVSTQDPRVGPRTVEAMMRWRTKMEDGKGRDEPDFVVAALADNDIDEGMARVLGKCYGWRFLRYPEQALDHTIGTAVLVGRVAGSKHQRLGRSWGDTVSLRGETRDETAIRVAARIRENRGDSRTA